MRSQLEYLLPFLSDPNKWTHLIKMGYNADIDNTWEDLISAGGVQSLIADVGAHLHILSASAEDDPDKGAGVAGTGAHTLRLFYLDASHVQRYLDINLNGAAAVETTPTDIHRINGCLVIAAGTGGAAAGTISIKNHAEDTTYGVILAGEKQMFSAVYSVPAGKSFHLTALRVNTAKADGSALGMAYFRILANYHPDYGALDHFVEHLYTAQYAAGDIPLEAPLIFPAGTDIHLQAKGLASDSNYLCEGWFEGFCVT